MISLVTILTLLVPIPVAAALYGLCVHVLHTHGRRLPGEVVVERREPVATTARGHEAPTVADARQVA